MSLHASTGGDVAVIVFARAPVPGRAKTRLIPRLGAWRAARLHARLIERTLRTARAAGCGNVELHIKQQTGRDLGERMYRAFDKALRLHRTVILIGTDCPVLSPGDLRRAARLLQGAADAVLAPAEDGGYALVGLRKVRKAIFEGIDWGSDTVLSSTLAKMREANFRCKLLRTVWDVDRPEDLDRLRLWGPARSLRFSSNPRRGARR
jgi:glycosyltransferase A (GT-A) superfamily protein (DUF2064 family)